MRIWINAPRTDDAPKFPFKHAFWLNFGTMLASYNSYWLLQRLGWKQEERRVPGDDRKLIWVKKFDDDDGVGFWLAGGTLSQREFHGGILGSINRAQR